AVGALVRGAAGRTVGCRVAVAWGAAPAGWRPLLHRRGRTVGDGSSGWLIVCDKFPRRRRRPGGSLRRRGVGCGRGPGRHGWRNGRGRDSLRVHWIIYAPCPPVPSDTPTLAVRRRDELPTGGIG